MQGFEHKVRLFKKCATILLKAQTLLNLLPYKIGTCDTIFYIRFHSSFCLVLSKRGFGRQTGLYQAATLWRGCDGRRGMLRNPLIECRSVDFRSLSIACQSERIWSLWIAGGGNSDRRSQRRLSNVLQLPFHPRGNRRMWCCYSCLRMSRMD